MSLRVLALRAIPWFSRAFGAGALLLSTVPAALAQTDAGVVDAGPLATAHAEILVMQATHVDAGPGSIDPKIGPMPQLLKPPFSAFNTYTLVERKTLPLVQNQPGSQPMVNGRTLQVTLLDLTPDKRFHVKAEINQPDGKSYLKLLEVTAAPNEPFFVGGQALKGGGSLVLAITMRP